MKLKFSRTTPVGKTGVYHAGQTYDVKDQAAAELYVKHGYATEAAPGGAATMDGAPGGAATSPPPKK